MRNFHEQFTSRASVICLLIVVSLYASAQSTQPPQPFASATALTSNSPTLTLPGSLTLTSTVAAPEGGGVPTGKVSFTYDATNALGSSTLAILPGTQAFPAAPSNTFSFGTEPFPFWATSLFSATEIDLATSDLSQFGPNDGPVLTMFPGLGRGSFNTSAPQTLEILPAATFIDAIASGEFKHDGNQELLLHRRSFETGYAEAGDGALGYYDVVDVVNAKLAYTTIAVLPCSQNDMNCDAGDPDNEQVVVDDFTGDGFADVASLVTSYPPLLQNYVGNSPVSKPRIRIAVNNGNAETVGFTFGPNATLPIPASNSAYCPVAISSGQFTNSGNKDIVSIGLRSSYISPVCSATESPGYLVLLLGDGKGRLTSQALIQLGNSPAAVGVGDFNKDGKLDVVVTDSVDNTVEILYGDGDGTFSSNTFTITAGSGPSTLRVADFNGDGYPDVAISDTAKSSVYVLLNDGTGKLQSPILVYTATQPPITILTQDMNGDGLPDITALVPPAPAGPGTGGSPIGERYPSSPPRAGVLDSATSAATDPGAIAVFLDSASAKAVFTAAHMTLPAGSHTLTATFPGDINFDSSTSAGVPVTVTQTTPVITWPPPAPVEYGMPLGMMQLNATANVLGAFAYTPGTGAMLKPGSATLSVVFSPADAFDYSPATASVPITVIPPSLNSISPTSALVGGAAFTLSVTGQGFTPGAVVLWNGSALSTTQVSLNQLTAQVPASLLTTYGTATVTVMDTASVPVSGSATFQINLPPAVAQASAPPTSDPGTQPSVQVSLASYPADVSVTLSLVFTPAPPNQAGDPFVLFANGTPVETFVVPANSTAPIAPISLQSGTTAGTITVTVQLTAGGTNITPATLAPIIITVPPVAPIISSAKLTRSGQTFQLVIDGLSSPRDMSQAEFSFAAVPGVPLKTMSLTVSLTGVFTTWYQNGASTAFGTEFEYTQPFTLDSPATDIQSVTVTLTNSAGKSQPVTAQ
jgi:hypothetical protein